MAGPSELSLRENTLQKEDSSGKIHFQCTAPHPRQAKYTTHASNHIAWP